MIEAQERQQAVQKFLAGAEMSKVCVSLCSTDWWIRRRVHFLQMSQPYASTSGCMRVYARIPSQSASLPLLNTIINTPRSRRAAYSRLARTSGVRFIQGYP